MLKRLKMIKNGSSMDPRIGVGPRSKLERVVFQNHLRKLPFRCFSGSENLKELHLSDTIPPVIEKQGDTEEQTLFFYFDTKSLTHCTVYVPTGSLQRYRAAYGWRKFKNIVEE